MNESELESRVGGK